KKPVFMVSPAGGIDIEEVAAKTPEKILKLPIDTRYGLQPYQAARLGFFLFDDAKKMRAATKIMQQLYAAFMKTGCSLAQINALKIITADPNVKAILFNIFGGITRTDDVANGIVTATKQNPLKVPIVIRLTGTNEEIAMKILQENGFSASSDMDEAVQKAVQLARSA